VDVNVQILTCQLDACLPPGGGTTPGDPEDGDPDAECDQKTTAKICDMVITSIKTSTMTTWSTATGVSL
jgi:hypothetical protein